MNISEAAEITELTPSTLRYYKKIGLIPPVERENGKNRVYSMEDLNRIEFIKCMKASGFSIDALVEYTSLYQERDVNTADRRKQILIEERDKLLIKQKELENTVERLNKKITNYDNKFVKCESMLTDKA